MKYSRASNWPRWYLVAAVLLVALVLRLVLIQYRWINADEGAHLMDGLLASQGLIPGTDFGARQPLYVYFIALFVRVFGTDYQWIRLFPVFATIGTGLFVYLIGRDLFNHETGLVAATLQLFLPFSVVLSPTIKTQMLTVLLSSAALYCVVRGIRKESGGAGGVSRLFVGAGVLLALAYYVRQSSLAILVTAIVVLFCVYRSQPRLLLRLAGSMLAGFSLVCVAFIGAFFLLGGSSVGELLRRQDLNPVWFVVSNLLAAAEAMGVRLSALAVVPALAAAREMSSGHVLEPASQMVRDQTFATALKNIADAVQLNGVLVVGAALSVFGFRHAGGERSAGRDRLLQIVVPFGWLLGIGLAYAFWTLQRGFFQEYFLEFIPPLSILTAAVATDKLWQLRGRSGGTRDFGLIVLLMAVFAVIQVIASTPMLSRSLYMTITAMIMAVCYLLTKADLRRWLPALAAVAVLAVAGVLLGPGLSGLAAIVFYTVLAVCVFGILLFAVPASSRRFAQRGPAFVMYSLLVSSLALTLVFSVARVSPSYLNTWSPSTVKQASEFIRQTTPVDAEVMSGAVIWEFQAGRRAYRNFSHPLSFRWGVSRGQRSAMRRALATSPPDVIVLDGYTEQTYLAAFPEIRPLLEQRYELVNVVKGSRYPVSIYRLIP